MKKFRVLGIISIIIIIAQIVGLFGDFSQGVSDGWNHAEQKATPYPRTLIR